MYKCVATMACSLESATRYYFLSFDNSPLFDNMYRVSRYLAPPPPPQHNWAMPDPKPIYFLDPTSIPDLHARLQITNLIYLLPVTRFMMRDRGQFCEQNMLYFLGCFNKNGYKIVNNWLRPLYHTLFKSYYITPCSETIVRLLSQLWLIF